MFLFSLFFLVEDRFYPSAENVVKQQRSREVWDKNNIQSEQF